MQTMHTGAPPVNEAEELKSVFHCLLLINGVHPELFRRFTGIEFAVVHSQPPSLFIIHKRDRVSADEGR